jgi:hypothetical protein
MQARVNGTGSDVPNQQSGLTDYLSPAVCVKAALEIKQRRTL